MYVLSGHLVHCQLFHHVQSTVYLYIAYFSLFVFEMVEIFYFFSPHSVSVVFVSKWQNTLDRSSMVSISVGMSGFIGLWIFIDIKCVSKTRNSYYIKCFYGISFNIRCFLGIRWVSEIFIKCCFVLMVRFFKRMFTVQALTTYTWVRWLIIVWKLDGFRV